MSFTSDLRKLLASSGRAFTETEAGAQRVFDLEGDVTIVSVPILSDSIEEASEVQAICKGISEARPGRQVMFVTQDRWVSRPDAMRQRILSHLGRFHSVFARNCEVRRIDKGTCAEFLEDCHSYGDAACKYRYGLFVTRYSGAENKKDYEGEHPVPVDTLVAVSEFSNARKWIKGDKTILSYEWIRYASLPGVRVSGGMSKMLKAFIEEVAPDDVMSYADLEWSDGEAYRQMGFVEDGVKEPVDFWIDPLFFTRTAIGKGVEPDGALFYRNFGSTKYRLKLTDYKD